MSDEFSDIELATARRVRPPADRSPLTDEEYCVLFRRFPILITAWGDSKISLTDAERQQVIVGQMTHQHMVGDKYQLRKAGADHPLGVLWSLGIASASTQRRARRRPRERMTVAQIAFRQLCQQWGFPMPVCEYQFAREALGREWRLDYAWPEEKVGLEVDGAIWVKGRHTRGSGWLKDSDKLNSAAMLGWKMLRCTPQQLHTDYVLTYLAPLLTEVTP